MPFLFCSSNILSFLTKRSSFSCTWKELSFSFLVYHRQTLLQHRSHSKSTLHEGLLCKQHILQNGWLQRTVSQCKGVSPYNQLWTRLWVQYKLLWWPNQMKSTTFKTLKTLTSGSTYFNNLLVCFPIGPPAHQWSLPRFRSPCGALNLGVELQLQLPE